MEIFFIVLGAIILLIGIVMFLPIRAEVAYDKDFTFKIKYFWFTLFDSEKEEKTKKPSKKSKTSTSSVNKESIKNTYKQRGITGAIKYYSEILLHILKKLRWVLRFIKIRKFVFDLSIASDDAADTAIEYGEVCCVIYPIISLIQTHTNFKFKTDNINVRADFDNKESKLKASVLVKARLIICLIAIAIVLLEYAKKQREESEKNERK